MPELARSEHFRIISDDITTISETQGIAVSLLKHEERQLRLQTNAACLLAVSKVALAEMQDYEKHMQQDVFETKDLLKLVIAKIEGQ